MDDRERIDRLEERINSLTREKGAVLEALSMATQLGGFTIDLKSQADPTPALLSETAVKLGTLAKFTALAFFLVNENDADFRLGLAKPEDMGPELTNEMEALIADGTFSWALNKFRPVVVSGTDKESQILLHAISTPSRTRGMFLGVLGQPRQDVPDIAFGLITTLLLSCANILESFELYAYVRSMNEELRRQRGNLAQEVAERTQDLSLANQQLQQEVDVRHRAERELRAERDFVSAVLDTTGALVVVLDSEDHIVRFNKACEAVSGYEAQEATGKRITDFLIPKSNIGEAKAHFSEARTGSRPRIFENDWLTKGGRLRRIAWSSSLLEGGEEGRGYLVHTGIDITEKTEAEAALRQAEATYRNIFENAVEGIFQGSPMTGFYKVNPAMARMFGYATPEEFLRLSPGIGQQLSVQPEPFAELLRRLKEEGEVSNYEMLARCRDHRRIWISVSLRSVPGTIETIEGLVEDITDRKINQMHLERRATYDELTDIPNRFLFLARFGQVLAQAQRLDHNVTVLYIDLDSFKPVNDKYGHHVGDSLLKEAARRLKTRVRKSDILARLGGDEFAVLLINLSGTANVERVAMDILDELKRPYELEGITCTIGASMGAAMFPEDGDSVDELLRKADAAMYSAKESGGNGFCVFDKSCSFRR